MRIRGIRRGPVILDNWNAWAYRGLVGWWCPSALSPTGLSLLDLSGNNNTGTLTNMDAPTDWVQSGGRLALDFDNTNDTVSMTSIETIRSGSLAVSCWYYPNTTSGLNQIFAQWLNTGIIAFRNGTALAWQIGNRLTTASVFTASTWHHVVCFRQADGTLRAMVNGVLDAGTSTATNQSSTEPFLLGGPVGGAGTGAGNCFLDDVRVYSRDLAIQEARKLYAGGRGFGLLNSIRRYPMGSTGNRRRRVLLGAEC